ncbi:translocation and assembly module lipoprotein TamL [Ochrovirga pacifica]|uniref:translocation and assembly module lipoprotein TamL n=1 Tax=Ochrovirga pacifica TaxID=1042376 RepID=UPI0002559FF1|nr:BamA/TamA family outer membrane protein [Ochrovirga pacifica]
MTTRIQLLTIIALIALLSSCSTTKYLQAGEFLLKKNKITVDQKTSSDIELNSYLLQRPNTSLLGIPLGLHLYHVGLPGYDSIHQQKLDSFAYRNSFGDRIFSKKQRLRLLEKRKKLNDWFLRRGEAPVILASEKTALTAKNLRNHFFNQGYFNATVKTTTLTDGKTASVRYDIQKKQPFYLDSIYFNIASSTIDSVIQKHITFLPLKKGNPYRLEDFTETIEKITQTLRNHGFFHFKKDLISFRSIDTLASNYKTPVVIRIDNRRIKKENEILELSSKIQKIKKIKVFTDYSFSQRNNLYNVQETYEGIDFYAHQELKHRVKTLSNSIFMAPDEIYSDEKVSLTRNHLRSLSNFKSVKINFKELDDEHLETQIVLTPMKKYGIGINTEIIHSNIRQIGLSGGFNFINRNTFKGAEIFQLALQGSIFDTATNLGGTENSTFEAYEVGIDASLQFPKFIFPFLGNLIPRTMTPKTKVSVGTSFQRNIGLDKQKISGIIDYNWQSSTKNSHTFEILNLQYINNLNIDSYYTIYSSEFTKIRNIKENNNLLPNFDLTTTNANQFLNQIPANFASENPTASTQLKNIAKRNDIITSNNLIPVTSYSFEHNSSKGLSDPQYNFFRTRISSSGNLSGFFFEEQNGTPQFENINISQFVKLDIDFRKFWSTSLHNSLAFRTFVGIAFPTGKNKEIPFITSYFAGGSNDIRAWKTYELGPGNSNSGLEFNIGNLKLLSSLEYRFKVINSFYGAVFVDAGNIWNLPNTATASEEEIFNHFKDLENIAVGSGVGLRYDFNFLVLRLDWAFKTFEPYLSQNKWFQNYHLSESVLNIGINYPF